MTPKHLTHFCQYYNLSDKIQRKMIGRFVMPLFEMKIFDLTKYMDPVKKPALFRNNIYLKTRQDKNFIQLVCPTAQITSNCRRSKMIYSKRDSLLEFFNAKNHYGMGFFITLSKANYFAPDSELLKQLDQALQAYKERITYAKYAKMNFFNTNLSKVTISQVLNNFVAKHWFSYINHHFPGKNTGKVSMQQIENSYLQVSILNFYKIKYSKNPEQMYEDMRDFDKMLSKFNFLRFFMACGFSSSTRNQKNCEALIKKMKWRTSETQDYLLTLVRNCSWERNCITIHNFVHIYETQFRTQTNTAESVQSSK